MRGPQVLRPEKLLELPQVSGRKSQERLSLRAGGLGEEGKCFPDTGGGREQRGPGWEVGRALASVGMRPAEEAGKRGEQL